MRLKITSEHMIHIIWSRSSI